MLVFGHLRRRNFQKEIRNNAKDDATGVIYIPLVCVGLSLPMHTLRTLYTHRGYLFARLFPMAIPTATNDGRDKGQIPTVFCL